MPGWLAGRVWCTKSQSSLDSIFTSTTVQIPVYTAPKCGIEPIWYVTLHLRDRREAARNRVEITVLIGEQKPDPICFPCRHPRGGTRDFKWRGWSNGAKSQDRRVWARIWSLGDNLSPWLQFWGTFSFLGGQKFVHPSFLAGLLIGLGRKSQISRDF